MIRIYGSSDDLIEIEGDIEEEFEASFNEINYVALSDGTLIALHYTSEGEWIMRIVRGSGQIYRIGYRDYQYNDYSEVFETARPIEWVLTGTQKVLDKR